jgi:hypothetical protein
LDKAKLACKNSEVDIDDHFAEVSKTMQQSVMSRLPCRPGMRTVSLAAIVSGSLHWRIAPLAGLRLLLFDATRGGFL